MFSDRTNWDLDANPLSRALSRHRATGKSVLDLTVSNPTACGFHYESQTILQALGNPSALSYQPDPSGIPLARQAVASYYADRSVQVSPEDILLTTGTSEAYSFIFRVLCNPGNEILIPQPGYPLLRFLADIQDVRLVPYPLIYDHGWQIDFPSLRNAITPRTQGIVVVHPNNPTGHFSSAADMDVLNKICSASQIALIADEVFLDFALLEKQPATFAAHPSALTFVLSGISKIAGLPQMKLAWLVTSGPEPWKSQAGARLEVIADTYLSMSAPVQWAAPVLLAQQHNFQQQLMARVRINLATLDRLLSAHKSCTRLETQGGWYAILRVPATRSDEDRAIELLATKDVYLHPGHFYDFPGDGHLVVSLITPPADFTEGIARLLSII
jgi:alanine-synthesizing transaminase